MTRRKTSMLLALLAATIVSHAAHAGMSGTSSRIQQQSAAESRNTVQAPPPAAQAPVAHAPVRPAPQTSARPQASPFDGTWMVNHSPGCGLGRGSVRVSGGRISGPGVRGTIDAEGNVRTRGGGGGITTSGAGRVNTTTGSGTYAVSTGCSGTWTAHKA